MQKIFQKRANDPAQCRFKDSHEFVYDVLSSAGYPDEPDEAAAYSHFVTFGPYDLNPGEKCKIVVAYVGGMGADDPKFSDYRRYGRPFNFEWINLGTGVGYEKAKIAQRQSEIPLGEDAMFRHFQRAIDAYNWGYFRSSGIILDSGPY